MLLCPQEHLALVTCSERSSAELLRGGQTCNVQIAGNLSDIHSNTLHYIPVGAWLSE